MQSAFRKNLLDKLDASLKKRENEFNEMNSMGDGWGSPIGGDWFSSDDDPATADVPNQNDDTPYQTQYVPKESKKIKEASYDVSKDPGANEESSEETSTTSEEETGMPPDSGGDMGDMGGMGDMTGGDTNIGGDMGGMGGMGEEEVKPPEDLGKTYELKKIYSRLISVESYLATSSDVNLLKLRNYVSQAIELFSVIIANVKSYTDRIDDIIVKYYEFLDLVYVLLSKYYNKKEKEENADNKGRLI